MLAVGDLAPEFDGVIPDGTRLRLSSLRGSPVVLFFYPKASSPGCTRESLGFASLYPDLEHLGVKVVGVSVDDREDQLRFAETCSLPFPLVADQGKVIARNFGVLGAFGLARRVTFVLDTAGRVQDVVDSFLPGPHVARVKATLVAGRGP